MDSIESKSLEFIITNSLKDVFYQQIIDIRKENFYSSPYDLNYWEGGLHSIFSKTSINEQQKTDPSSYFALAIDHNQVIKAYSRFSTKINNEEICNKTLSVPKDTKMAMLHVIAASKAIQGKKQNWKNSHQTIKEKVGTFFYKKIVNFCREKNSQIIMVDICIYPIPNIPSLILHKNLDFIPLPLNIEKKFFDEQYNSYRIVKFLRLAKVLSLSSKLERFSDQTLHLVST